MFAVLVPQTVRIGVDRQFPGLSDAHVLACNCGLCLKPSETVDTMCLAFGMLRGY